MTMKKFRGQDVRYDDPKKKNRRKSRSSSDEMGNRFPNGRYDEENKRASKTHS
jgi:hypothetical protein